MYRNDFYIIRCVFELYTLFLNFRFLLSFLLCLNVGLRVRKREERLRILRVRPSTVLRGLRCRRRPVRSRTASSSTTSTGSRAVRTPRDSWPEEEDRLLTLRRAAAAIVWRPRPVTRRSAPPLSPDPRVAPRWCNFIHFN